MTCFVYDAAVLVAVDRDDKRTWSKHKARLERGIPLLVPAPVVAQVSRSPRQAQLRRFLAGCKVVPFNERDAHEAGRLLGIAGRSDVVDAAAVTLATHHNRAVILTGDTVDIERLVAASGQEIEVIAV